MIAVEGGRPGDLSDIDPEALHDLSFYRRQADTKNSTCSRAVPSRRRFLRLGAGALAGALLAPSGASAAISQLMCPPAIGRYGTIGVLGGGGGGGGSIPGAGDLPRDYASAVPDDGPGTRHIRLFRPRFGETFDAEFVTGGSYNRSALEQFNHFCRDGSGEVGQMDPKVLDLLWNMWKKLGMSEPFSITSGYRSPAYNSGIKGAAKGSYHMQGCALDIQASSIPPRTVYAAAMREAVGGVGRYSSFTHIDTRGYHVTWG